MAVDGSARRPTILEVARLAEVSHQTVSRYFRAPEGLKPATKARVEAAVRELGYRPNLAARSMRTRQTDRLAVIVPALAYSPARMLAGAGAEAHAAGYAVDVLSLEGGAEARTRRVLELADSGQVDGIVSFAPLDVTDTTGQARAPIVESGEFDDEMRGIGGLTDASAVVELIEGLVARGHRRFLHVTGAIGFASARARRDAYADTVARLGVESLGTVEGDWSAESGRAAIHGVSRERPPTAVIAANDLVAAGVIRGALERGWRVPEDLSVTGWDNQPLGQYLAPSLTSVDVDLERLGAHAMARLIATLRGTSVASTAPALTSVIWRESTGSAPAG